jgi:hypothetical protein
MTSRRLLVGPSLGLILLVLLTGALLGVPAAAQHHHDGPGLYNPDCPLAALATVERQGGLLLTTTSTMLVVTAGPVVEALLDHPSSVPAADARLRAPPTR